MNLFKEITSVLGWISGSAAGIAAIFYGCGYLIKRAQLNLLGIGALFSFSQEQYMQEGARFVADMADRLSRLALPLLLVAITCIGIVFFLRGTRLRSGFDSLQKRYKDFSDCRPLLCRSAAYAALLILLIILINGELSLFSAPLAVSDLLFIPTAMGNRDAATIRQWLLAGDRTSLDNVFFNLTLSAIKSSVLLLLAWRVVEPWRLRVLLTAPFAVVFMLCVLMLPMSYGVLKRPARFPLVAVNSENKMVASLRELYLLDKTTDEFVLWDPAGRRVLWLPRGEVKSAEIWQSRFLFGR